MVILSPFRQGLNFTHKTGRSLLVICIKDEKERVRRKERRVSKQSSTEQVTHSSSQLIHSKAHSFKSCLEFKFE